MSDVSSKSRFDKLSIFLHWIVGVGMLALCFIGLYMKNWEIWSLYDIHKSFGIAILFFVAIRIFWRIKKGFPAEDRRFSRMENVSAKLVQLTLIALTLSLPVTGMIYSAASGHGFEFFSLPIVSEMHGSEGEVVPRSEALSSWGSFLHTYLGYALLFFVSLHLLGALKHHFVYKNEILRRMFGFRN